MNEIEELKKEIDKLKRLIAYKDNTINDLCDEIEKRTDDDLEFIQIMYSSNAYSLYECTVYLEDRGWKKKEIDDIFYIEEDF